MNNRPANHYVMVDGGIEGTIDTSSLSGRPSVDLRIGGRPLSEPELCDSEHGIEVTALVDQVPDSHTVHLRLVVPRVNVQEEPRPFVGLALLTTARTSIGGPALVDGALHRYEVRPVGGTAEAVDS